MVHRGPARGCLKCKERHVKCDLERPQCKQCVKQKIACPGYRHAVDVVMRDQTAAVVSRYQKPKSTAKPKPKNDSRTDSRDVVRQEAVPGKDVTPSLEVNALSFFFSKVVLRPTKDWRTSHGHLDFVLPLHKQAASDSALAMTVSWMAVMLMGSQFRGGPYALESDLFSKAVSSIHAALSDPVKSLDDETLAAVMILQYGSELRHYRYKRGLPPKMHQNGAEAIIRRRGILNFRSDVAMTLFGALRSNAVEYALLGDMDESGWELWHNPRFSLLIDGCKARNPAMYLDHCAVDLVRLGMLRCRLRASKHPDSPLDVTLLQEEVQRLLVCLESWHVEVPQEWLPKRKERFVQSFDSADITFLFNQFYLLKLEAVFLQIDLNSLADNADQPEIMAELCDKVLELVDNVIASEESLLGVNLEAEPDYNVLTNDDAFPTATVERCKAAAIGSRFLNQGLERLCRQITKALGSVELTPDTVTRLIRRLSWAEREIVTIRRAWPLKDV